MWTRRACGCRMKNGANDEEDLADAYGALPRIDATRK